MASEESLQIRIGNSPTFADIDCPQLSCLNPLADCRFCNLEAFGQFFHCLVLIVWHFIARFCIVL